MSDLVERYWRKRDAEGYDSRVDSSGRMKTYQWIADKARPHLEQEGAISMDLGCGTGIFAKTIGITNIIGVDISPPMLEIASTRMEIVYEDNIFEIQLEKNSVDNIITLFVLADYPTEKKKDYLHNVYTGLKHGGRFFFSAYSPNDGYMGKRADTRSTLQSNGGSFEVYLEDLSSYESILKEIGFKVECSDIINSKGSFVRDSQVSLVDREFIVLVAIKE